MSRLIKEFIIPGSTRPSKSHSNSSLARKSSYQKRKETPPLYLRLPRRKQLETPWLKQLRRSSTPESSRCLEIRQKKTIKSLGRSSKDRSSTRMSHPQWKQKLLQLTWIRILSRQEVECRKILFKEARCKTRITRISANSIMTFMTRRWMSKHSCR